MTVVQMRLKRLLHMTGDGAGPAVGYALAIMMFDVYTSILSVPQSIPTELKGIAV